MLRRRHGFANISESCAVASTHVPVGAGLADTVLDGFTVDFTIPTPRFDMPAFRLPGYHREHSSDHVLVATAEFLMNFRTDQTNLSYTDSDTAILQQETETVHDSEFQLLLHSQPVGFGLLVKLPPNSLLIFLQMLMAFSLMPLKFCRCFFEQTPSLGFQRVACDTNHLIQQHSLMRSPGLHCLIFESTHSFPHFRSGHVGGLCNCDKNFITSCLPVHLSCSFQTCLLEVESVFGLALASTVLGEIFSEIIPVARKIDFESCKQLRTR